MTTEGIFDFLRGDRTISVTASDTKTPEIFTDCVVQNEIWTLYTLNPESKDCPLDCLIVSVHQI